MNNSLFNIELYVNGELETTARLHPNDIIKVRDFINNFSNAKETIKNINKLIDLAKDGNQRAQIALSIINDNIQRYNKEVL